MSVKVGERGQVVIPKSIRDEAGIHPGDQVDFEFREGQVVLVARPREMPPLGGRFKHSGMAGRLLEDRRREPR